MSFKFDTIFDYGKSKKQKKREQLQKNIRKGKAAEESAVISASLRALSRGRIAEVEKTGRGSDHRVRERDVLAKSKVPTSKK